MVIFPYPLLRFPSFVCHRGEIIPATNLPRRSNTASGERPPYVGEFASRVTQFGWEPASVFLSGAKRDYPGPPIFSERGLTIIGYNILGKWRAEAAVEVFKVLVRSYRKSANAYDSLADGFAAAGKNSVAVKNAETSIKLANDDPKLDQKTPDGIIKSATDKLKRLKN